MDLHRLRIFATIAQEGSFTRTAELLFITQPTVSQQLAQLERELGVSLIERHTRSLRLTEAGEALLPFARQLLELELAASEAARKAAGMADQTLRLGVGHLFSTYLLPELLRRFQDQHQKCRVHITTGNTAELLDFLDRGSVEIALVGSPAECPNAVITPFMEDRLVVIVEPNDKWARKETVGPCEVLERTLIIRERGSALHAAVEMILGARGLEQAQKIVLGESEAIKRCVESGLGIAVIQRIAAAREVQSGALRMLRLSGALDTRTYSYAVRRGADLTSAARSLIGLLA